MNIINLIREDKKSKSKSFYLKNPYQKIDEKFIFFLKKFSKNHNNCDLRICIHQNPNSNHHDMLIIHHKRNYYPPHLHKDFGDTYLLLSGKMAGFIFNRNGKITYSCVLGSNEIFKIPENSFHTILPLTNKAIFYEFRAGPFKSNKRAILPGWAPLPSESLGKINQFKKNLINYL